MKKHYKRKFIASFFMTFSIALPLLGTLSLGAQAQNKSIYTNKKNQVTFKPPKGDKPQHTVGGASRGEQCPLDARTSDLPITPLIPTAAQALTVKSHPTILVYLPETSAEKAYFAMRDESEDYDYQTILPISDNAGIVSLTLPKDAPDLSVDREYQWSLVLMCEGKLRPDSPITTGSIKRVASTSDMARKLPEVNLFEDAAMFAQAGIWYDSVAALAQLKMTQPNDKLVSANWQNLLATVGLEKVAKAEFVE